MTCLFSQYPCQFSCAVYGHFKVGCSPSAPFLCIATITVRHGGAGMLSTRIMRLIIITLPSNQSIISPVFNLS